MNMSMKKVMQRVVRGTDMNKEFSSGFILNVYPPDRSADVMHYLITGELFCGRSLEGVTWEEVENKEYTKIANNRAKQLMRDMENAR